MEQWRLSQVLLITVFLTETTTAARLTTVTSRHNHIRPILTSLHWLPVVSRVQFRVLLLTYKVLSGLSPPYIQVTRKQILFTPLTSSTSVCIAISTVAYDQRYYLYYYYCQDTCLKQSIVYKILLYRELGFLWAAGFLASFLALVNICIYE